MRRSILMAIAALSIIGNTACAKNTEYPQAPKIEPITEGEMPIFASYAFYDPALITRDRFLEVREAGFNFVGKSVPDSLIDKTLNALEGTGLAYRLGTQPIINLKNYAYYVEKYKDNPLVKAYTVGDEPKMSQFKKIGEGVRKIMELDSTKLLYSNLLPAMNEKYLEAPDYDTYVEEFVREVNPAVISFDCYPVKLDKSGNIYTYERFYDTLETISRVARESERPFWSFICSSQHLSYPKPSREYLRYQIFSALAYGAQGLLYYTYCVPDFKSEGEYINTPLDKDGNRTDVWYMVRDVNREVHNLEKVFLGAEVIDMRHTGVKLPRGTRRLRSAPAPFRWIEGDGEGVLVSHLRNGDEEFVIIVNRDVTKNQRVRFGKSRPVTRIYGDGSEKEDNDDWAILPPGGYAIYRL